jgi:phosphofructokinase-like protein
MKIGILTGGGDCPGLNAVIRAVVVGGHLRYGDETVGFLDGWRGAIEGDTVPLTVERCRDILPLGGTVIGTSRTNPFAIEEGPDRVLRSLDSHGIGALVAVGGEDTLGVAAKLYRLGAKVVGVPKTIDNDLSGTEVTFGFDTAVQVATDAIDRLRTTAESHHRVIVCEVMGRHAGWIAAHAGIAGGAAEVLVPEFPFDVDEVCARLKKRHDGGLFSSIVVVAEGALPASDADRESAAAAASSGAPDAFGHARLGGIGAWLAEQIEQRTGFEARVTILGHVQRGGTPTAFDRVLATRMGVAALEAAHEGDFGTMVALSAGQMVRVPLEEATKLPKTVDPQLYHEVARLFAG